MEVFLFRFAKEYCCQLQCISKSSGKIKKCIQDKDAINHILKIFRNNVLTENEV